jgi:protein ImuB
MQSLSETLRRWGIKTLGAFAALPAGDVYERLGARGVLWQRLAHGQDTSPLVPWVPEEPFEAALELEWPIEGLEPLSFVFGRLLEPLAERLERTDRGAAILHTHLRLVSKEVHARTLELPAPMRDPRTLRTLMLLDLESNPPSAAIDRVRLLIEPTPARVLQWMLFERAQPSPEQVSTLLARLTALMGDTHVGSPRILDTWRPGAFAMEPFQVRSAECGVRSANAECRVQSASAECGVRSAEDGGRSAGAESRGRNDASSALRRFRLPVPARVQVQEGRPVTIRTDRRGVTGGAIVQAAGPWRTSGDWWNDATAPPPPLAQRSMASFGETGSPHRWHATHWDRDEWDVALVDGTVYRIYVERDVGQWFVEGVVD